MGEQQDEIGGGNEAVSVEVIGQTLLRHGLHEEGQEEEEVSECHAEKVGGRFVEWPDLVDEH